MDAMDNISSTEIFVSVIELIDDASLAALAQSSKSLKDVVADFIAAGGFSAEGAALLVPLFGVSPLNQAIEEDSDDMGSDSSEGNIGRATTIVRLDDEPTVNSRRAMHLLTGEEMPRALRSMRQGFHGYSMVTWQMMSRPFKKAMSSCVIFAKFTLRPEDVREALGSALPGLATRVH